MYYRSLNAYLRETFGCKVYNTNILLKRLIIYHC